MELTLRVWRQRDRSDPNGQRPPRPDSDAGAVAGGTLVLAYESTSGALLDSPDNLCVTPAGGILFCEDDANPTPAHRGDTHPLAPGVSDVNRLIGLAVLPTHDPAACLAELQRSLAAAALTAWYR